jgi:putative sigma-54 modulation protein
MTARVEVFTRNLELTERIQDHLAKKASRLDRYLAEVEHVKVDLAYVKSARSARDRYVAQITARGRRALLRTEERASDVTAAFDTALDKMQRQMERFKGKHYHARTGGRAAAENPVAPDEEGELPSPIVRRKTFELVPMRESEALEQMKLLGHDNFFVFFNIETDSVGVLYRRRDGTYGLIEPKTR